jgi:23S rRNA pseudouridine2457 synthase
MYFYYALNKPANMLSQFIKPGSNLCLADLKINFPSGIHALGRLDKNTEGLLLLTNNPAITQLLFDQNRRHSRTYLVQVIREVSDATILKMSSGMSIPVKGDIEPFKTSACKIKRVLNPIDYYPVVNKLMDQAPHTWLLITLQEGRYHQIKKMVRLAGHPCRQLIRISIEDIELDNLASGQVRLINEEVFFNSLKIKP